MIRDLQSWTRNYLLLNYDSIQPVEVEIDFERRRWLRILDLESASEMFKVFYSLQDTIGITSHRSSCPYKLPEIGLRYLIPIF